MVFKKWRLHKNYKAVVECVAPEKVRKRFVQIMKERYEALAAPVAASGMLTFCFYFIFCSNVISGPTWHS